MLVTKQQLAARKLCAKDKDRFDLAHLKITPARTGAGAEVVVTNGHVALQVNSRDLPGEGDVPLVPRQIGADPDRAVYLHAAAAAEAVPMLPSNPEVPGFQIGRLRIEERASGRTTISIGASDTLTHHLVETDEPDELRYPDVGGLIARQRAQEPKATVLLSAAYVAMVAQYAAMFAATEKPALKLSIFGPGEAVLVEWEDPRHRVEGLLMPLLDATARREALTRARSVAATSEAATAESAVPPLSTPTAEAIPGITPLVPADLSGVDDARARAALNAREKAVRGREGRTASRTPEPEARAR